MINKLVSVIMSTHNTSEEYVLLAVQSILNQTYRNLELIVIIDGGEYSGFLSRIQDKRLRIIKHKTSLGLGARLNEGIAIARGEYIARMDSDDYALPDRIKKQYNYMDRHKEVDICSMFSKNFIQNKKVRAAVCTTDKNIKAELFLNCILVHPTIMFRSASIDKYNIKYDESFHCAQDFELWTRLIGTCTFAILPEVGIFYRKHDKQISANKSNEQVRNRDTIIVRNLKRLGFSSSDIRYIEMIQKNLSKNNLKQAEDFINQAIEKNKTKNIYDSKTLRRVLYRHLFTTAIKNRDFLLCLRVLRPYDFYYIFKTVFFVQKCNCQVLKYNRLYKEITGGKR